MLYCFGRDANGERGDSAPAADGSAAQRQPVTLPGGAVPAQAFSGFFHCLVVSQAGELYTWGAGSGGQLGAGKAVQSRSLASHKTGVVETPILVRVGTEGSRVMSAAGGRNHSLACASAGGGDGLFTWGRGTAGQLGHGVAGAPDSTRRLNSTDIVEPLEVLPASSTTSLPSSSFPPLKAVAAGEHFSAALTADGEVWAWGEASNGRLGRATPTAGCAAEPLVLPRSLFGGVAVSQLALGWRHVLAATEDGALFSWGGGASGQLGLGAQSDANRPMRVESLAREDVSRIAAGRAHSLAGTRAGLVFAWGDNGSGQCGWEGREASAARPTAVGGLVEVEVTSLAAGAAHSAFLSTSGRLLTWCAAIGPSTCIHYVTYPPPPLLPCPLHDHA